MAKRLTRALQECTFCYACNNYCPNGLKPYSLLMQRNVDAYAATGKAIPSYIDYFATGKGETNAFGDVFAQETTEEKRILDKWEVPPAKSKEVLVMGCVGRMIPYGIEHSKVFADIPKYSPRDLCCGELPHRLGDYDFFSERVERTRALLEKLDTERMVTYCGSCGNYYGNIWPNYHGVKLPFEVVSVWEWLWDRYQKGEVKVQKKITGKFALSDSCYSSEVGDKLFDAVRGLCKAVGMEIVELKNNRFDNRQLWFRERGQKQLRPYPDRGDRGNETGSIPGDRRVRSRDLLPRLLLGASGPLQGDGANLHYGLEEILVAFGDDPYPASLEDRMALMEQGVMKKIGEYMQSQQ